MDAKAAMETIKSTACGASYRPDLSAAAAARYRRLYREVGVKRGIVKPTKMRTSRHAPK